MYGHLEERRRSWRSVNLAVLDQDTLHSRFADNLV